MPRAARAIYGMRLQLGRSPALPILGLLLAAAPTATNVRGANLSTAVGEMTRSSTDSLDRWIDSVWRQHKLPAIELEDGTWVREESQELIRRIEAGELPPQGA